MLTLLKYLWTLPNTLVGCSIGILGLLTGGRVQRHGTVLEFHGGFVSWFLSHLPNGMSVLAMTWGYSILGRNQDALEITRAHELVHVEQYGRWGPFFGPAYLFFSWRVHRRGGDAYRENPFEVEAYARAPVWPKGDPRSGGPIDT